MAKQSNWPQVASTLHLVLVSSSDVKRGQILEAKDEDKFESKDEAEDKLEVREKLC